MANSPTEPTTHYFDAPDGGRLAWHEIGDGRPVVLIHGLFSNAHTNWIKYGHAAKLAVRGRRVIMPDLRAHGASARSHDPADYPRDVLADDGLALLAHLALEPGGYDLGGYSLGGRTTARMMARGARPGRAMLAGMGLEGLLDLGSRASFFRKVLEDRGTHVKFSSEWMAEAFLRTTGGDPEALLLLMDCFPAIPRSALDGFDLPVMVLTGSEDHDNGSAAALAGSLPDARLVEVPGNHMSAVTAPEFGDVIADWFARPAGPAGSV